MNFSPQAPEDAALELEEKNRRIDELETEVAELTALLAEATKVPQVVRSLKSYKAGDYVSVMGPLDTEPVHGRVVELIHGGSGLSVATAKGEVLIGDPTRIRKQSETW